MKIQADQILPIQKTIIDLYKKLQENNIFTCVKERVHAVGGAEMVLSCRSKDNQFDVVGYSSETKSRKESFLKAELNALCVVASVMNIEIQIEDIPEQPKKVITWSNKTVLSYKQKGVEALLKDMEDSGIDITPINSHRSKMPEGSRLTVQEIARVFFPTGVGLAVVADKPTDPGQEQKDEIKLSRMLNERDDFIDELTRLNRAGWSETNFKESQYKPSFKSLMDFAKFATNELIDHAISHAV